MNNDVIRYTYTKSPHGDVLLARNEAGLTNISFQKGTTPVTPLASWQRDDGAFAEANEQLRAYFYGAFEAFDLPLAPTGTDFQQRVWNALLEIPCGETRSYADVAARLGQPTATRAVASANARNPIPIVIPCHRVIGSDGKLRGYAGGLSIKAALLDREWEIVHTQNTAEREVAAS